MTIRCGEVYCDRCGDCIYCHGDDPCYDEGDHSYSWTPLADDEDDEQPAEFLDKIVVHPRPTYVAPTTSKGDALVRAVQAGKDVAYRRWMRGGDRLRVALDLELDLLRDPGASGGWSYARYTVEQPWARNASILGLRVLADPDMPRGVWRILDADDTLLHDPREGKTLREIREQYR